MHTASNAQHKDNTMQLTEDYLGENTFIKTFFSKVFRDAYKNQQDNSDPFDFFRRQVPPRSLYKRLRSNAVKWIKERLRPLLSRDGTIILPPPQPRPEHFEVILANSTGFAQTWRSLANQQSRDLMIEILAMQTLGPGRVKLSRNDPEFWECYKKAKSDKIRKKQSTFSADKFGELHEFDLREFGIPLRMHCHEGHVMSLLLEMYAYREQETFVGVQEGDCVIDVGGCFGESTLAFACKAGEAGKVIVMEFLPENLTVLNENIAINPGLQKRISVEPRPAWSDSSTTLSYAGFGAATQVRHGVVHGMTQIQAISIDDLCRKHNLGTVDFIKMDIEGSEMQAIRGASETIRKFRPKLAISVYHKWDDLIQIPEEIKKISQEYRIFLDHYTLHEGETVLFAIPCEN